MATEVVVVVGRRRDGGGGADKMHDENVNP